MNLDMGMGMRGLSLVLALILALILALNLALSLIALRGGGGAGGADADAGISARTGAGAVAGAVAGAGTAGGRRDGKCVSVGSSSQVAMAAISGDTIVKRLPQEGNTKMALPKRIVKETERLMTEPVPGISAVPHEDNLRYFDVEIHGPSGSPTIDRRPDGTTGGIFQLELFLTDDYPMVPPKIRFLTKIYHPNVDKLGRICLDVLKNNWSPALQIRTILLSIQALLGAPNPEDPLAADVAKSWLEDQDKAIATAKQWTKQYAKPAEK
ncbi:hypothetical protein NUW58_g10043 [Xylaria curta]|uniref:Uncharacterized protein n=1 Tax=Xylaria curta TaxID=42375 RepID=A0ACC1MQF6_9PEZI|nr:hypothetical protein NUW58_g10043 [Xylaria curta]